ncbi:MAG: GGDEF domain-containing protein [Halomonadaceae bacterium]|nr:MAG: GGDEF domain-containing protein [Halomonadaceae bacterium]
MAVNTRFSLPGKVLAVFSLLVAGACVAEPVTLTGPAYETNPAQQIYYLEDPSRELGLKDLPEQADAWQRNQADSFNRGYSDSAWWLRFELHNRSDFRNWLLEVAYPVLDYLDIYVVDGEVLTIHYAMGNKQPFKQRPVDHRYFVAPLTLEPDQSKTVYIRVESSSSIQVPLVVWEESAFVSSDRVRNLVQGAYYGALAMIIICNLLLYLALSERTYLYYLFWALSMGLFVASLDGWTFQYLWPNQLIWNDQAIVIFLALVVVFGAISSNRYLDIANFSKRHYRNVKLTIAIMLLVGVSTFWLPYSTAIKMVIPVATIGACALVWVGTAAWLNGVAGSRYFLMSWSIVAAGSVILALSRYQVIPANLLTNNALQFSSLFQVVVLSFGLSERYNQERQLRFQAQQETLETQRRATALLEKRVIERTQALEVANLKLHELSTTDQLTGLRNRRFLDEHLETELARSIRTGKPLSVLLLDVDHFKLVNDTHGHPVGDDCLQELARRLKASTTRATDLTVRYGGEEFCALLPDTHEAAAMIVAERIRETIAAEPVLTAVGPLNLTVSIGVRCTNGALPTCKPEQLLSEADQALYQSKEQGRNRSTLYKVSQVPPAADQDQHTET